MKPSSMKSLVAGLALSLAAAGCTTYTDASGRTVFGLAGRSVQPSPEKLAEARRDARLAELERSVARMRTEVDGIGNSLNGVSSRTETVNRLADARGAELVALKSEIAALRGEVNAVKAKLDAVPGTLGRLIDENNKSMMADVEKAIKARVTAVASAPGARRGSGSGKYYEHEVGAGQTLSEIAKVYGVTVSEIMAENNLKNDSLIRVGQKLLIPAQ